MRGSALASFLVLVACGTGAPVVPESPVSEVPADPIWRPVAAAGRLEIQARDRLASGPSGTGMVFRVVNHGETPVLVDLRSTARAVVPDAPAALRLPLSDEQIAALAEISALTMVAAGGSAPYAVPFTSGACTGRRRVEVGGVLDALDEGRTIELVADGAHADLSCADPVPAPPDTAWVTGDAPLSAPARAAETFTDGGLAMIRAASVTPAAEVSLLPFSYDARPVERWRYDACVSLGRCPARAVPQPPGSIRAPAVGMTHAAAAAFCEACSLRALTAEEAGAVPDPAPARAASTPEDVVAGGFRCGRSESEATPTP